METFAKLFERFLIFVYHCFDRIVIQGYLPLLTRPEHIVHFFRDVHGLYPITPQVLAKPTLEYRGWVEGYARNHKIPILKAEKGVSKEDSVRPHLQPMERRNQHVSHRGSKLPHRMATTSSRSNSAVRESRFAKTTTPSSRPPDPKALQAAADKLTAAAIEKRLNYWSWLLSAPSFQKRIAKPLTWTANTPSTRSNTAATSFSNGTSRSTRFLSTPAKWDCSAWPPIKSPTSSGCASPNGYFPLFQRMALPVMAGKTKIAGIKIHDTRMMRLMEVLLHGGTQLNPHSAPI